MSNAEYKMDVQKQAEAAAACRLVFIDGVYSANASDALPAGVAVLKSKDILPELSRLCEFMAPIGWDAHSVNVKPQIILHIKSNAVVLQPLHVIYQSSGPSLKNSEFASCLVVADANSRVRVLESASPNQNSRPLRSVTDFFIQAGAIVEHDVWQSASEVQTTRAWVGARAEYTQNHFTTGGKSMHHDLQVRLAEASAAANLRSLSALLPLNEVRHRTWVDHLAPETRTEQNYKAVVADTAKAHFGGMIHVHPVAQKTAAAQMSKNLLLGKTSEVNARPELRIEADDVKCTHGATVGQIDPEALFYLQSRGLSVDQAIPLLIRAFANDVLSQFSQADWIEKFATHLSQEVMTRENV